MAFRAAILSLVIAAAAGSASAQQPAPADPPLRGEQWYGAQLTELAEVLGGSHYLRILCNGRGDQRWRDAMRGVIQREPDYNASMVEGFNRGYRNEEARFPECDATARQMEAELRARGLRVSQALSARHGDR
jgi:uncharacterized protein (TIGR02301 family)